MSDSGEESYAHVDPREERLDPTTTLGKIWSQVQPGQSVLDVGCGGGRLAKHLKAKGAVVVGIERNPASAAAARSYCERVVETDLAAGAIPLPGERFHVIVLADVLEHLADPASILPTLIQHLAPGGVVVVSVPNIAYYKIRWRLLCGRFDYEPWGIMDRTHLRFFTRRSICDLLLASGLEPVAVDGVWGFFLGRLWARFPRVHAALASIAPRLFAIQWVITARAKS